MKQHLLSTKRLGFIIVLFFMICSSVTLAYAENTVGYINLNRLIVESNLGKAIQVKMTEMKTKAETVVSEKANDINGLKETITKEFVQWPPSKQRQESLKLEKMNREYERLVADSKQDLQREKRDRVNYLLNKADSVLKAVAKAEGYAMIIKNPDSVGFVAPEVDITDLVIKEMNKIN